MLAQIQTLLFFTIMSSLLKLSNAFCIYNTVQGDEGTTTFWIRQHPQNAGSNYLARFANYELKQGEKACCAYTNTDCVRSGNREDEIKMVIRRKTNGLELSPMVISLMGGGWIELGGGHSPETATIDVYKPDGEPYDYTYVVDNQAGYQ